MKKMLLLCCLLACGVGHAQQAPPPPPTPTAPMPADPRLQEIDKQAQPILARIDLLREKLHAITEFQQLEQAQGDLAQLRERYNQVLAALAAESKKPEAEKKAEPVKK